MEINPSFEFWIPKKKKRSILSIKCYLVEVCVRRTIKVKPAPFKLRCSLFSLGFLLLLLLLLLLHHVVCRILVSLTGDQTFAPCNGSVDS